jgi:hypothetical protein
MSLVATLSVDDGSLEPARLAGDMSTYGLEPKRANLRLTDDTLLFEAGHHFGAWDSCRASSPITGETVADCTIEGRAR